MESLSVKWRPKTLDEIVSQGSVVKILKQQLTTKTFKNCYLFAGASGCGKTTAARAFANALNEGKGSPIEIDGASNNGVENVRNIVKSAQERSIDSVYKIYIIDECHMISTAGWNAFLKCVEEPPAYTIFIFCTTDPQKIPNTILNRVQRFNITKIPVKDIENRLSYICQQEGYTNYSESVDYIAKISNGGMRDAIANLEKCASYSTDLSIKNVLDALGGFSYQLFFKMMNAMIDGKEDVVINTLDEVNNTGNDIKFFVEQFTAFVLDLAKFVVLRSFDCIRIPYTMEKETRFCTEYDGAARYYNYVLDKLLKLKMDLKQDSNPKVTTDIVFLQITRCM